MIYDGFSFFNELDVLEIRLNELAGVVDRFVLVEATRTHQGTPKPLYFEENRARFHAFEDKIIHVVVDTYPNFFTKFRKPTGMDLDNNQKNSIARGLTNCAPDDRVIISDLDEIPSADMVLEYAKDPRPHVFAQYFSNYYANYFAVEGPDQPSLLHGKEYVYWKGSVMITYRDFKTPQATRKLRNFGSDQVNVIEGGGWHLSFLGGLEKIREKLKAWCHGRETHYNPEYLSSDEYIAGLMESGRDLFDTGLVFKAVEDQNILPAYIVHNKERFSHLIKA